MKNLKLIKFVLDLPLKIPDFWCRRETTSCRLQAEKPQALLAYSAPYFMLCEEVATCETMSKVSTEVFAKR